LFKSSRNAGRSSEPGFSARHAENDRIGLCLGVKKIAFAWKEPAPPPVSSPYQKMGEELDEAFSESSASVILLIGIAFVGVVFVVAAEA
jgi:hypothetical protein